MNFTNFTASIAILGYGIEGKSTENYLLKKGYKNVVILDEKEGIESVHFPAICGKEIWNKLKDFDVIFRSPGISPLRKNLLEAKTQGIKLTSHTELFMDLCPVPIIAVTGTKGKGTTSSLIQKIIEASGKTCFLGGNIGTPPLDFLDQIGMNDAVVLEVSSFQAFSFQKSPHIAVILMTTQEHLDYHKDIAEYWQAKANMITDQTPQSVCIYNMDFEGSRFIAEQSLAHKIAFSLEKSEADKLSPYFIGKDGFMYAKNEKIIHTNEIKLLGKHNWNNALAAIAVAKSLNIPNQVICDILKNFSGLPFRLEVVVEKDGILFINDSFSTVPETTIAAIQAFPQQNIVVMIGGAEKKSNYSELAKLVAKTPHLTAVCYGKTGPLIHSLIEKQGGKPILVQSFDEAFIKAKQLLTQEKTGVLLMSPACSSFDEFLNYKKRGEKFRELVAQQ